MVIDSANPICRVPGDLRRRVAREPASPQLRQALARALDALDEAIDQTCPHQLVRKLGEAWGHVRDARALAPQDELVDHVRKVFAAGMDGLVISVGPHDLNLTARADRNTVCLANKRTD